MMKTVVFSSALKKLQEQGHTVYFVAATLRPETMYGQTNFFVLPEGKYGAYEVNESGDVFIMGEHAARNMAFQGMSKIPHQHHCCSM